MNAFVLYISVNITVNPVIYPYDGYEYDALQNLISWEIHQYEGVKGYMCPQSWHTSDL